MHVPPKAIKAGYILACTIVLGSIIGLTYAVSAQSREIAVLTSRLERQNNTVTTLESGLAATEVKLQLGMDALSGAQKLQGKQLDTADATIRTQSSKLDTAYQSVAKYLQLNHTLCQADYAKCEPSKGIRKGFAILRDGKQFCHIPEDQSIVDAFNGSNDNLLIEKFKNAWNGTEFLIDPTDTLSCPTASVVGYSK